MFVDNIAQCFPEGSCIWRRDVLFDSNVQRVSRPLRLLNLKVPLVPEVERPFVDEDSSYLK
jgi:hypothetical protein